MRKTIRFIFMEFIYNRNVWLHLLQMIFENLRPSIHPSRKTRRKISFLSIYEAIWLVQ